MQFRIQYYIMLKYMNFLPLVFYLIVKLFTCHILKYYI